VGRFDSASEEIIPYSDKCPERCEPARGPAFLLPGEDEPRRCGEDSAMPPATDRPHWKRRVRRGYEDMKR
jgi:hypothetical protein